MPSSTRKSRAVVSRSKGFEPASRSFSTSEFPTEPVAARCLLFHRSSRDERVDPAPDDTCVSGHENRALGGSVRPRAYGRVIRDGGLLGERSRQAVLDDGLRARAFRWPPLRLARIVPRARIGLCRSPAASPVFVNP